MSLIISSNYVSSPPPAEPDSKKKFLLEHLPKTLRPTTENFDEHECFKEALRKLRYHEFKNLTKLEKKALNKLRSQKNQNLLMKLAKHEGADAISEIIFSSKTTNPQKVKDINGNIALHYAAKHNFYNPSAITLLKDCDVNALNHEGETPLHLSLKAGLSENALKLIRQGADLNLREDPSNSFSNMIKYDCLEIGINHNGLPTLQVKPKKSLKSLFKNYPQIAFKLFDESDSNGMKPIDYALKEGNFEMFFFLWQKGATLPSNAIQKMPKQDTQENRNLARGLFCLGCDFDNVLDPNENKLYIDIDPQTKLYATLLKLAHAGRNRKNTLYPNFYEILTAVSLPKGKYDFISKPTDRLISSYSISCLTNDQKFQEDLKFTPSTTPNMEFVKQNMGDLIRSEDKILVFEALHGAGSTFLLKKFAWDSFHQPYNEDGYKVVYVPLKGKLDFSRILSEALGKYTNEKILWLLDGYHQIHWEMDSSGTPDLQNLIQVSRFKDWPNSKFVFTCSPDFCKPSLFSVDGLHPRMVKLPELSKDEVLNLAKSFLKSKKGSKSLIWNEKQYLDAINKLDPQVLKAFSNPLILKKAVTELPHLLSNKHTANLPDLEIPKMERPSQIEPAAWSLMRSNPKLFHVIASKYSWNDTFAGIGNILHLAIQYGQIEMLEELLTSYKEQTKGLLDAPNEEGKTPAMLAAAIGNLQALSLLHENQANLHAKDKEEKTALHWAVKQNHLDCVRFLVDAGLDVNANDISEKRPLDYTKNEQIREILLHPEMKKRENSYSYPPIHNLILQGDDIPSALEALEELESSGKLNELKRISGQGHNSLIAGLLALGKSSAEIRKIVESPKLQEIIGVIPKDEQLAKIHCINSILIRLCHYLRQDPETASLFDYVFSLIGGTDRSSLVEWMEQIPSLNGATFEGLHQKALKGESKLLQLTLQVINEKIQYLPIEKLDLLLSEGIAAAMTSSYLFTPLKLNERYSWSRSTTKYAGLSFPSDSITESFDFSNEAKNPQFYNLNTLEIRTWNPSRNRLYERMSALFGEKLQFETSKFNKQRVIVLVNDGSNEAGKIRKKVKLFFENAKQTAF